MKVKGGKATLRFTHVGGGLVAKGGPLKGFTIAGADRRVPSRPRRDSRQDRGRDQRSRPQPVAVRYGWANVPEGNLFNKAGLPASPFRTDAD